MCIDLMRSYNILQMLVNGYAYMIETGYLCLFPIDLKIMFNVKCMDFQLFDIWFIEKSTK